MSALAIVEKEVYVESNMDKARRYLKGMSPDDIVDWTEAEIATGIRTDKDGRATFRRAAKIEGFRFQSMPAGTGIQLTGPETGLNHSHNKARLATRSQKRAYEFSASVLAKHGAKMHSDDLKQLATLTSFEGSVLALMRQTEKDRRDFEAARKAAGKELQGLPK